MIMLMQRFLMSKEDLHFNVFDSCYTVNVCYSPGLSPVNATTLQFGLKLYLPIRNWLTFPYKIIGFTNYPIKIHMLWALFYNWNIHVVKGNLSLNTSLINERNSEQAHIPNAPTLLENAGHNEWQFQALGTGNRTKKGI